MELPKTVYRYDNYFLIKSLASNPEISSIDVLGQTTEKYTRITTPKFVIHDSMSHLVGSLDNLCASLRQRGEAGFYWIRKEFPEDVKFQSALRKLVYPYDYIDEEREITKDMLVFLTSLSIFFFPLFFLSFIF